MSCWLVGMRTSATGHAFLPPLARVAFLLLGWLLGIALITPVAVAAPVGTTTYDPAITSEGSPLRPAPTHNGLVGWVEPPDGLTTGLLRESARESRSGVAAKTESRVLSHVDDLPCNCFVGGTTVKTAGGEKLIEDVEVGDRVWARDLETGKNELRMVTGLFHKHADRVMTITVTDGAKVTVTEKHPFYVAGLGWVMSGGPKVGDQLAQRDGGSTTITAIDVRAADTTVYNFTVDGDHNYYVTEAQLLVHNCPVDDAHNILNSAGRGVDVDHVWANGDLYTQVRGADTRLVRVLSRGNGQNDVVIRELDGSPVTSIVISDNSLAARIADGRWQ